MYFPTIKKPQTSNIFKIFQSNFSSSATGVGFDTFSDAMSERRGPVPNGGGRHEKSVQFRQYDLETWICLTLRISHWTLEALNGWMNSNEAVLYFVGVFVGPLKWCIATLEGENGFLGKMIFIFI